MATAPRRRDRDGFRRFVARAEEVGIAEPLREIARAHGATLLQCYSDDPGRSVHSARLEQWWWLGATYGKSAGEVARLYDRDPSSVLYGLQRLRQVAAALGALELSPASAREAARGVAAQTAARQSAAGVARERARRAQRAAGEGPGTRFRVAVDPEAPPSAEPLSEPPSARGADPGVLPARAGKSDEG